MRSHHQSGDRLVRRVDVDVAERADRPARERGCHARRRPTGDVGQVHGSSAVTSASPNAAELMFVHQLEHRVELVVPWWAKRPAGAERGSSSASSSSARSGNSRSGSGLALRRGQLISDRRQAGAVRRRDVVEEAGSDVHMVGRGTPSSARGSASRAGSRACRTRSPRPPRSGRTGRRSAALRRGDHFAVGARQDRQDPAAAAQLGERMRPPETLTSPAAFWANTALSPSGMVSHRARSASRSRVDERTSV